MTRRGLLQALTGWRTRTSARLVMASAPPHSGNRDLPNIVLSMTDDQGWGDTSYNRIRF